MQLPRWESIHPLLGLSQLCLATGDESFKTAFLNLWQSVRRLDIHNNGSFSTNEKAEGTPSETGAIETCCPVTWMGMTIQAVRLTADPVCAEALESATYNTAMAVQHPSGSWATYNTPMNGRREAPAHTIVFQSRPEQPELNCRSVNAPCAFGMITEWGLMKGRDANNGNEVFLNYYGPCQIDFSVGDRYRLSPQRTCSARN